MEIISKNANYDQSELVKLARDTKDPDILHQLAENCYLNPEICVRITGNKSTSKKTLHFLAKSPYTDVRKSVAERGEVLNGLTLLILASDRCNVVKEVLSRTTNSEGVLKHLLKNNPDNKKIVGNIFRRLNDSEILNNFIFTASDVALAMLIEIEGIQEEQFLVLLDTMLERGKINVKRAIAHPKFSNNTFEKLIKSIKLENLTETDILAILESEFVIEHEEFIKQIIDFNNSNKILRAVLSVKAVNPEIIKSIIEENYEVIVSDFNLTKLAILKTTSTTQRNSLLTDISYVSFELIEPILNFSNGDEQAMKILASKSKNTDVRTMVYLVSHPKTNTNTLISIVEDFISITSPKAKKIISAILRRTDCSLEILELISSRYSFEYMMDVIMHPNCTLQLKKELYLKIKKTRRFTAHEKEILNSTLVKYGKDEYVSILLLEELVNNKDLCDIYLYTESLEVKKKVAKIVSGNYFKFIVASALSNGEDTVLKEMLNNPNMNDPTLRRIFKETNSLQLKIDVAHRIRWSSKERLEKIEQGVLNT